MKGLAISLLLLLSMAIAEETVCEFPADYVQRGDLASLSERLSDDSASMRRMIEVNTRKIDEMINKQYASSAEVQNISRDLNNTISLTSYGLEKDIETHNTQINERMFHLRIELMLLMLFGVTMIYSVGEYMNKRIYREFLRRAGVYPRREPMTARERLLQNKIDEIEKMLEKERPDYVKISLYERLIPVAKTIILIAILAIIGIVFMAWMGWA